MGAFTYEGLAFISDAIDDEMEGSRVRQGDVLLNITGASIGRVCVVPDEVCPANVNQHVCIIRCTESMLPEYLAAVLASRELQDKIWESQAGGTRQALTKQIVEDFVIPWRPKTEQRRITSRLKSEQTEVETARQAAQRQAQDIALLRVRLLKEMLATLAGVPCKVLGDHASTTSGTTPPRGTKRYWEPAEIPWVKTGEVAFAPITRTEEAVSRAALAECSLTLLPPRTVLVAMYGQGKTRGQSAILEVAATTNQACLAILPNDTWEPEFLYYWFVASYQDLRDLSDDRGGNQANLNGALLKALKVPAPDRVQQLEVVSRIQAALQEMATLAAAGRSTLTELELLPQRLLAQAFEN
ncbi:MAG: restriction endonuclease subunit S [Burkholderiales bacterium]|nr:restriction endonuclease subunit S [Burkholderiales bacterium]